jgi:dephospho-CoA kinase
MTVPKPFSLQKSTHTIMLKAGITGGIGSGKSTVCRVFEWLGIPVYDADDRAKKLMTEDEQLRSEIRKLMGEEAYLPDGSLNRARIAGIVFQNEDMLRQLNALVHPAVHRDGEAWHLRQSAPYTLREAALLYESGGFRLLDKMVVVTAPVELRIERVMVRDGVDRSAVEARLAKQWPEEKKVELGDFVIVNDGNRALLPQILEVHRALMAEISK